MDGVKTLNLPNCALCSLPFSSHGVGQFRNIKLPLILHCGDSACEKCLNDEFKKKKEVKCKLCGIISLVSDDFSLGDIAKEFPINHYLAGMWYLKIVTNCSDLDSSIGFPKPKLYCRKRPMKTIVCTECSENPADYQCKQCAVPYCAPCFKLVHSYAKAFRSHVKLSLLECYLTFDADKSLMCLTHSTHKLEYYCAPCRTPVCSHCIVESHNGHTVDKIEEVEIDYEEDFIQSFLKVSNMIERMKDTKKKAESILKQDQDISEIKKADEEITKYFILLHGKLSIVESKLRKKLSSIATRQTLKEIIKKVTSYIEDAENILASTRTLLNDDSNLGPNCLAVIENLKSRYQVPCHLIESPSWKGPRFTVDDSFLKTLENHCCLDFVDGDRYQLVSEENLPSNYEIQPIKTVSKIEVLRLLRKPCFLSETSSVCDSERAASPSPSVDSEKSFSSQTRDRPSEALFYADEIAKGCSVSVRISHLVSPSHFYVQREYGLKKLLEFQASIRPLQVQRNKPPPHPEKGKVYLALYEADNKWYRARVVNVINRYNYEVLYVDFGNSEVVDLQRLRNVPKTSLNMPFLAYRCQLSNCVPRCGEEWDPRAISLMTEIIDNDFVTITVVDKTNITYVVDLYKVTENSFINLRESLCFHELASMTKMFNQTTEISVRQNLTTPPGHQYSKGDIFEVHISHVNSPHNLYIQDFKYSRKLLQLSEDLQRVYNIRNLNKNAIYDPKKGMLVAARYSKDSKWYRAIIKECLEGRQVRVFFIDFGDEEVVIWENIKLLSQRFVNLSSQGLKCTLSDVYPQGGEDCWSKEVCLKFHELIFNKKFKIIIENVENNILEIVLYQITKDMDLCINAVIVNKGLAISTGLNSAVAEYPKLHKKKPEDDTEIAVEKRKVKKSMTKPSKSVDDIHISDHFITMPGGAVRTRVIVKNIVNPGEFYVMPSCFEDRIKKLNLSLQEFYEMKEIEDKKEWSVDDRCVVNCDGTSHRAVVSNVLPDGQIKVNCVDEGIEMIVDLNHIDVMDPTFAEVQDGVVKCHLGGLEPTLSSWSALSISEFEEFVMNRKYGLYISQLGKIKGNSLPVELFSRMPIDTGPTEPIQEDWKSLNHYLRFIGQAKADGMIQWDSEGKVLSIDQGNDSSSSVLEELIKGSMKMNVIKQESNSDPIEDETKPTNEVSGAIVGFDSWLPPVAFTSLEFVAAPTYVDENCVVYLHDFHKSEHLLEEISTALCTKYDNSLPRPHDATLEAGDICIAKYHLDNKWYRAVLLEKIEETNEYKIRFVDYGNIEVCKLVELRKMPVAQHIPIQCHKCCFHKLVPVDPSGKWKERHIETVQYSIVDKNCQIKLIEIPGSNLYGIEKLTLPDGRNYISEMVKEGMALFKKSDNQKKDYSSNDIITSITNSKSDEESSSNVDDLNSMAEMIKNIELEESLINELEIKLETKKKPALLHWSTMLETLSQKEMPAIRFRNFEIPPVVKSLIVDVSAFLSPLTTILHIEDVDEDPVVLKMLEDFKELSDTIQIEGPNQPPLQQPYKYKACCALFSLDKRWYRGFVLKELADDQLLVQYVDYGNVEVVHCSCVKEIKEEWVNLEVQGLLCTLFNVTLGEDCSSSEVLHLFQDCLAQGAIKAEIMERNPDLQVELYINEKLAYEKLIDLKLFKFINSFSR